MAEGGASPEARIDYGFRLLLARSPKASEQQIVLKTFQDFEALYGRDPKAAEQFLKYGDSPRRPGLAPGQLAAYTTVASLLLNMDATITKE